MLFCNEKISQLPESLASLANLQRLKLHQCFDLTALPETLGHLTQLISLDVEYPHERMNYLPASFSALTRLELLRLGHMCLKDVPASLANFTNLQSLEMSVHCEIGHDGSCSVRPLRTRAFQTVAAALPSLRQLQTLLLWRIEVVDGLDTSAGLGRDDALAVGRSLQVCVCVCVYLRVCVCVCVCV